MYSETKTPKRLFAFVKYPFITDTIRHLGQAWYLIVSISEFCTLTYMYFYLEKVLIHKGIQEITPFGVNLLVGQQCNVTLFIHSRRTFCPLLTDP